jgi:integrase/recombinase XerD
MKWTAKKLKHNGQDRIAIYFEGSPELNQRIKKLEGVRWSATKKVWHLPDTLANRERFKIEVETKIKVEIEVIGKVEQFKRWMRSLRYSDSTVKTY